VAFAEAYAFGKCATDSYLTIGQNMDQRNAPKSGSWLLKCPQVQTLIIQLMADRMLEVAIADPSAAQASIHAAVLANSKSTLKASIETKQALKEAATVA